MATRKAKSATALPWQWPEETWRGIVGKVRAGRSLKPARWKDGARVAVALSFDSDHESGTLREGESSPGKLSQGQYGSRQGVPRILALLERQRIPATFFVPAVIATLYPDEQRRVVEAGHEVGIHGWIHERNSVLPAAAERDLQKRSADTLERMAGVRPVGIRTPSWDFSAHTLAISREMGLLYDSSLMADDDPYELLEDGQPTGIVELPVEWIRDDAIYFNMDRFSAPAPLHATVRRARDLQGGVRRRLRRGGAVPPHHAPPHHRPPIEDRPPGAPDRAHPRLRRRLVRHARRHRALRADAGRRRVRTTPKS